MCVPHEATLSIIQLTKNINDNWIAGKKKRCEEFHFVGFLFLGAFATNNSHATTRDVQTCIRRGGSGAVKRGFREKGRIASTCLGIQIRPFYIAEVLKPASGAFSHPPTPSPPSPFLSLSLAHCPKSNGLRWYSRSKSRLLHWTALEQSARLLLFGTKHSSKYFR